MQLKLVYLGLVGLLTLDCLLDFACITTAALHLLYCDFVDAIGCRLVLVRLRMPNCPRICSIDAALLTLATRTLFVACR